MECNFEGLEGIMPKVSTANAHLLLFALVCIKNLFIGKSSFMDKT